MGLEVLIDGKVRLVIAQLLAYIGCAKAGTNLVPIGDVVAEQGREAGEMVLAIGTAGDG